jgi:mono/diheme cytochrome c family protein
MAEALSGAADMRAAFGCLALMLAVPAAAQVGAATALPSQTGLPATAASPVAGAAGKVSFEASCGMCHRQGGMGTVILARRMDAKLAPLEARTDLTAEFVIQAARSGIGNMPRISRGEVSDKQLAAIAAYLEKAERQ